MKKRSLITVVLSLVLALMLPLTSLAATEVKISVTPGEMLLAEIPDEMRTAMVDLFKVVSLKFLSGEKSGMLTLALNDKSALDIAFRGDEEGIFVQSAILGDKPLYFNMDDLMDVMVAEMKKQDPNFDEEAFRSSFEGYAGQTFANLGTANNPMYNLENVSTEPVDFTFDKEAGLAAVAQMYPDDPGMVAFTTAVMNKTEVTEGEFTSDLRDPADVCMTMTMTSEDFVLILDSKQMEESLNQVAAQENKTLEEVKAEVKDNFMKMDMNLVMNIYLVKKGSEFVGMDMYFTTKEDVEEDADVIGFDIKLNRLTSDVVTYTFTMIGSENDVAEAGGEVLVVDDLNGKVTINGSFYELDDNGAKEEDVMLLGGEFTTVNEIMVGWISMVSEGEALTVALAAQPTDDGMVFDMELFMRENAAAPVAPVASDSPMFGFRIDLSENVSDEPLTVIDAATIDGSLQLLKMSESELMNYVNSLSANAMRVLTNAIGMLPSSVLMLFTQMNFN